MKTFLLVVCLAYIITQEVICRPEPEADDSTESDSESTESTNSSLPSSGLTNLTTTIDLHSPGKNSSSLNATEVANNSTSLRLHPDADNSTDTETTTNSGTNSTSDNTTSLIYSVTNPLLRNSNISTPDQNSTLDKNSTDKYPITSKNSTRTLYATPLSRHLGVPMHYGLYPDTNQRNRHMYNNPLLGQQYNRNMQQNPNLYNRQQSGINQPTGYQS